MINVPLNFWLKANANISSSLHLSNHFTQRCAGYEHPKQSPELQFTMVPIWCLMSKEATPYQGKGVLG